MKRDYIPVTKQVIYQDHSILSYSIDTVLLDYFSKKKGNLADIGCGTGYLSLKAALDPKVEMVHAFDIQERAIELLKLSAKENGLDDKIEFHLGDVQTMEFSKASLDTIITNPPFFVSSLRGARDGVNQAKHIKSIEAWFKAIGPWLKFHGDLYTILDTAKLEGVLHSLSQVRLEPKSLRFVHKKGDKEAMRVLVWAKRGGKAQIRVEPPLILFKEDNSYTEEVGRLYGKDKE